MTAAAATALKPAKTAIVVTSTELLELSDWERKYVDAKKKVSAAEKELEFRRQSLAEKCLGVNSADELKRLSPLQVQNRFTKGLEAGDWKLERGAPEFTFSKTNQGQYPSWSKLFISEMGETAAAKISRDTPLTYSYCVVVAASE